MILGNIHGRDRLHIFDSMNINNNKSKMIVLTCNAYLIEIENVIRQRRAIVGTNILIDKKLLATY